MLLYVYKDYQDYWGRGAQDSHLDFHTAPSEFCACAKHKFCPTHMVNLFTATLATPSLGKRPIKVPNLKSVRLSLLLQKHMKGLLIKLHNIENKFVIGQSDILFADVYVCTF